MAMSHPNASPPHQRMMVVAWETTKSCPLRCQHCRADASSKAFENELSTAEGKQLLDGMAQAFPNPMIILSGGEPMAREDIYELAQYAVSKKIRVVMSPCGPSITPETVEKMKQAQISCLSISLDGKDAETHDAFRGIEGIYEQTLRGISYARGGGMPFQINSTITRLNAHQIPEMLANAVELGAMALDLFFLVPTGRGKGLSQFALDAESHEETLRQVVQLQKDAPIPIRVTCAPHWVRIHDQMGLPIAEGHGGSKGCLAGKGFLFVSHRGVIQPCGFLQLSCGDLRQNNFDFKAIYQTSEVLRNIQDPQLYTGSCGKCKYNVRCGGCRARAYEMTGNYLSEEPFCKLAKHESFS